MPRYEGNSFVALNRLRFRSVAVEDSIKIAQIALLSCWVFHLHSLLIWLASRKHRLRFHRVAILQRRVPLNAIKIRIEGCESAVNPRGYVLYCPQGEGPESNLYKKEKKRMKKTDTGADWHAAGVRMVCQLAGPTQKNFGV